MGAPDKTVCACPINAEALFLYPNSYPIFNLNGIRPRMVEASLVNFAELGVLTVGVVVARALDHVSN